MPSKTRKVPDALGYMGEPFISVKCIKQVIRGASKRAIEDFEKVFIEERQKKLDEGMEVDIRSSDKALRAYVKHMKDVTSAIAKAFDNMKELDG